MPAIVVKSYKQCQAEFAAEIKRLAELAFRRMCRNNHEALYLVGTKRKGMDTLQPWAEIWERLSIASADEHDARKPDLMLVRSERLPMSVTLEHLGEIIRDWLKREPLWIFAD